MSNETKSCEYERLLNQILAIHPLYNVQLSLRCCKIRKEYFKICDIVYGRPCNIVSNFKDNLIFNCEADMLSNYFKLSQSREKLKKIFSETSYATK